MAITPATLPAGTYFYGLGRRKSATARARLYAGKGKVTINEKPAAEYLSDNKTLLAEITDPLALVGKQKDYDITIRVAGGGTAGQVDAIKLAIAKALTTAHSDLRSTLKKADLLKRDSREKERKKYGLRSARKREQFSKR
jgi:small subunit ribosomal protein S9